jgi:methionine-rich copper-binding protein CopC
MSHTFHIRRSFPLVVTVLLAAASILFSASAARAHEELASSDPASGATLDVLPAQLTLTFSGELLDDDGATVIAVTDAAGTSLVAGSPVVDDNVVTQPVAGDASGAVTVVWKVVSSDGHPISGEYSFAVEAAAPVATPTPTESTMPTAAPSATPLPEDPNMTAVDLRPWFIGALVLLLVVAGAVLYVLVMRVRREKALEEARFREHEEQVRGEQGTPDADSDASADR